MTGAVQGLGKAMAKGLLECGVKVCILDISSNLKNTVSELKAKGYEAEGLQVDLSDRDTLVDSFSEALNLLDEELDILVNNAGIHKPQPALTLAVEDFQSILDINVTSVFRLSQLAAEEMRKKKRGRIINIASVLALQGGYNASAYSSSKGAVTQLTKSLSNEWAKEGINVNAIAPGYFHTELNRFILEDEARYNSLVSRIPANRFGNPEELSGIVQFLSSEKSNYINGAVIPVDGGFIGR